jgi:SAM-dependent methyltransferase
VPREAVARCWQTLGVVHHPLFARIYGKAAEVTDRAGAGAHRAALVRGLSGRILEIGAGSGLSFAHYPPAVTEVLAVEPEPHLRRLAQRASVAAPVPVRVVDATADCLPAPDGSFDGVVMSLVLCTVPSSRRALREAHRILRHQGLLRFYEHVRAESPRLARIQDRTDWVWSRLAGGCHANRDTAADIAACGFRIEHCDHFSFRPRRTSGPTSPHILGRAVRV